MRALMSLFMFLCAATAGLLGPHAGPPAASTPATAETAAPDSARAMAAAEELLQRAHDLYSGEKYEVALAAVEQAIALAGETEALVDLQCDIYWKLGRGEPWLAAALKLERIAQRKTPWHCLKIAEAHLLLGQTEPALAWIGRAVEEREFSRYQVFAGKAYDPLRGDARFGRLVARAKERVGLDRPAAEFTLALLDGTPLTLSSLRGRVVLVDFWATWCAPCQKELPQLQKLYRDGHERGLEIVAISLDEDKEALARYVRDRGIAWKVGFSGRGWQDEIVRRYGVNSLPAKYLIDRRGMLRQFNLSGEELARAVRGLLDG